MIVSKTPLRVSFFGGGTDLPEHFNFSSGAVLSTAINTYMYITLNDSPRDRVKACYDEIEIVSSSAYLNHNRIRECLLYHNIHSNIEVASFCSTPTKGTGLGSSSSYTVGLCNALAYRNKTPYTSYELAEIAYFIERNQCGEKLGKQDQYAAAFGGLNLIKFEKEGVEVTPVNITMDSLHKLENNLMFFFTNSTRVANDILKEQAESVADKRMLYSDLRSLAFEGHKLLTKNKIDDFGHLLDANWDIKKKLSDKISNQEIDEIYLKGIKAGAIGGKLLGAGSSGFIMFYVPEPNQNKVRESLSNLKEYKMKFSQTGSEIVYAD
jgi:D-glycero-alpha-D-manno-heptose-7-phosphate kinase